MTKEVFVGNPPGFDSEVPGEIVPNLVLNLYKCDTVKGFNWLGPYACKLCGDLGHFSCMNAPILLLSYCTLEDGGRLYIGEGKW